MVASPKLMKIVELNVVKQLVEAGNIVDNGRRGRNTRNRKRNGLFGVDAVIDKDKSSAKLAVDLNADMLLILTAVDRFA